MKSLLISSPHTHAGNSIQRTMLWVIIALLPATLFGLYQFGWPAINLLLVTLVAALLAEAVSLWIAGKPIKKSLLDGSALLTGLLLALTLPPWAPWWVGLIGALIAIIIGKHVFGGLGQNLFNPAMVARVALLISFPLELTTYLLPKPLGSESAPDFQQGLDITFGAGVDIDTISSASILGHLRTETGRGQEVDTILTESFSYWDALWGAIPGSMGETSATLILLGGLLLLALRIINWAIPVAMLATVALLATLFNLIDPGQYPNALYHLLSGSLMLGAFFIATDLVTSPVTFKGQLLFGAGCGVLVFVIRSWSGYPEGVAFAVLLMNALTPLIDHYLRPRIFGRDQAGRPLDSHRTQGKKS